MEKEGLKKFEKFLFSFKKKNGKKLGRRTIDNILTLAKFIEDTKPDRSIFSLKKKHKVYLKKRNHPIGKHALWLYLKFLGYNEKFVKEVVQFNRRTSTALTDQEKLAEYVLSKKELLYLVDNISKLRDKLIVKLLYDTGARVSELTNIKIKDIDGKNNEIQIMGKGRKPRTVFFQESTAKLLKQYLKQKDTINPNIELFSIKPITVWYHLKKYGNELLSRDVRPHMFRHTRLQHMADEGVDSFLIKSYAGHSDIGTTQIYVKSSKHQGRIAFKKAGDVWDRTERKNKNLKTFFG